MSRNNRQKNRWVILCSSVFVLLFLQIAESLHEHAFESDSDSHQCLICHKSHNGEQAFRSDFAGLDLLPFTDELIKALPAFASQYSYLTPRARSPPVILL